MIDPEIHTYLKSIQLALIKIEKNTGNYISAFLRGVAQGAGSIVGAALVLVVIGWVLNVIGVIPAFRHEVDTIKQSLERFNAPRP